jgi:hypothetical protein
LSRLDRVGARHNFVRRKAMLVRLARYKLCRPQNNFSCGALAKKKHNTNKRYNPDGFMFT